LSKKDITISWGQYMRIGLLITPPVLLIVLVALVFWMKALGAA
jgi:arsenical pump membrane protein